MKKLQFASVLLLALVATGCSSSSTPQAAAPPKGATIAYSGGGAAASCSRPTELGEPGVAFEGIVTEIEDGVATLRVTWTFVGETGERVRLKLEDNNPDAVGLTKGQAYLISATDGDVDDCLSGPADDALLLDLYENTMER